MQLVDGDGEILHHCPRRVVVGIDLVVAPRSLIVDEGSLWMHRCRAGEHDRCPCREQLATDEAQVRRIHVEGHLNMRTIRIVADVAQSIVPVDDVGIFELSKPAGQ